MEDLQERLKELTLDTDEFLAQLPEPVRARVSELKALQTKHNELEEAYKKERDALRAKYEALYGPLYKERAGIIAGEKADAAAAGIKGIPKFWCTVLMRCDVTRNFMNEKDPLVLEYLTDIQAESVSAPPPAEGEQPLTGFKLKFFFAENPYFTNKVLEKTYYMLDEEEPVLERAEGTTIDWNAGKNVTVKVMKKKPKKGARPDVKPQTKTENVDSFFHFFSPPQIPGEGAEDMEEEEMEQLEAEIEGDYEMGDTIRNQLIPHAVEWYTGEALEDMSDDGDDEDLVDEDEDDDDDEEGEEGAPRPKGRKGKGAAAGAGGEQPECKQQ